MGVPAASGSTTAAEVAIAGPATTLVAPLPLFAVLLVLASLTALSDAGVLAPVSAPPPPHANNSMPLAAIAEIFIRFLLLPNLKITLLTILKRRAQLAPSMEFELRLELPRVNSCYKLFELRFAIRWMRQA
jgi:hypothetical protein